MSRALGRGASGHRHIVMTYERDGHRRKVGCTGYATVTVHMVVAIEQKSVTILELAQTCECERAWRSARANAALNGVRGEKAGEGSVCRG